MQRAVGAIQHVASGICDPAQDHNLPSGAKQCGQAYGENGGEPASLAADGGTASIAAFVPILHRIDELEEVCGRARELVAPVRVYLCAAV